MGKSKPNRARLAGRRVYVQVHSPRTGRSTTVTLPYVYDGGVDTAVVSTPSGKRVVGVLLPLAKGQRGLVPIDRSVFEAGRRQSVALAAKSHKGWVGIPPPEPAAPRKAAKGSPASRKAAGTSKPAPKGRSGGKGPAAPTAKAHRTHGKGSPTARTGGLAPSASTDLTDAAAGQDGASAAVPAGASGA